MTSQPDIVVRPVANGADLEAFIGVPRALHGHEPNWVPPVNRHVRSQLAAGSAGRGPLLERELLVAWQQGSPVGRIAATAQLDHAGNCEGTFGHFETIDKVSVSKTLLESAAKWLVKRGATQMIGPTNGSPIDETGILIDGFDGRPSIGEGYNPAFYGRHLSEFGFRKLEDFLAYQISYDDLDRDLANLSPSLYRIARKVGEHPDVRVRGLRWADWQVDVAVAHRLYVDSHATISGHRSMSLERFQSLANALRPILVPDLALVVEVGGKPAGLAIALLDLNEALQQVGDPDSVLGRVKLLWKLRRIETIAFKLLGILPGFRKRGLESVLILELARRAVDKGFEHCEISLVREGNAAMRQVLQRFGAKVRRTYRVYERPLVG